MRSSFANPDVTAMKLPMPVAQASDRAVAGRRVIRVMHVTNGMTLGGTEKVVLKLARQLGEGFDHHICCIRQFDADLVRSCGVCPEQFTALDLPHSRFAVFVPRLVRVIRAWKPDIVHSRNWGAIEAVFAARLAGVPGVIHSEHGYDVSDLRETPLRQRWVRRLVCSTADVFFAVSRELRDFHAQQAGVRADRIRVLYNGVDVRRFVHRPEVGARVRAEFGIPAHEFVIGAVGRMVKIKDYQTLIRAAGVLLKRGLKFKLMLVGDGPELANLTAFAETIPGMKQSLISAGQRNDVADLLSAMDVFVQTSLREGMSNTILEAMSAGLPVMVTGVGGNPEIVEEGRGGWTFKPGDVEHLSRLLFRFAVDPDLRACAGHAARQRVHEMFSNQKMLENYRGLYSGLIGRRGARFTINRANGLQEGNGQP